MATPKKKVSRSRRNMRRFSANKRMKKPTLVTCANCSEPTRPHRVCKCGHYSGREVVAVKKSTPVAAQA